MRIPEGAEETNLYIERVDGLPSELQIFTKDGRHIFGKEHTAAESALALTNVNGFELGASYSKQYLNTPPTEVGVPVKNLSKTKATLEADVLALKTRMDEYDEDDEESNTFGPFPLDFFRN